MRSFLLLSAMSCLFTSLWGGPPPLRILTFQLDETPDALTEKFGSEANIIRHAAWNVVQFYGPGLKSERHDCDGAFEWEFFYDRVGQLHSVTWNPKNTVAAAQLFPEDRRETYSHIASGIQSTVLIRRLFGGRLLIASVADPKETTMHQVVLMRADSLGRFLPWLAQLLADRNPNPTENSRSRPDSMQDH